MLRLTWWDLIGYPSFVHPTPCKQMDYYVVLLLLYLVFGIDAIYESWSRFIITTGLFIVHDNIIVLTKI
jgi:hypothetical protein